MFHFLFYALDDDDDGRMWKTILVKVFLQFAKLTNLERKGIPVFDSSVAVIFPRFFSFYYFN